MLLYLFNVSRSDPQRAFFSPHFVANNCARRCANKMAYEINIASCPAGYGADGCTDSSFDNTTPHEYWQRKNQQHDDKGQLHRTFVHFRVLQFQTCKIKFKNHFSYLISKSVSRIQVLTIIHIFHYKQYVLRHSCAESTVSMSIGQLIGTLRI